MLDHLAIHGGMPTRTAPFPTWPPVTASAIAAVNEVVTAGVWGAVDGPAKLQFERDFAAYHGATRGVAVCNGTVSLEIALRALGVGHGDEVIVPAYTFLATATSVLAVNGLPVFADIEPSTACLDPDAVEALISPRTRAIIAVHFGGQPADLDRLGQIAAEHGVPLVEDAAHAHGSKWRDRGVGSFGSFGSWSFQASKNMTSGEGGIVVTSDDDLAEAAWTLHNCGRSRTGAWYEHDRWGGNYRLTEFQSALLLDQLSRLGEDVARRERAARIITDGVAGTGLQPMARDSRTTAHSHHLLQLRYDPDHNGGVSRDDFVAALVAEGIPCSGGYGRPLEQQRLFTDRAFDIKATGWQADNPRTDYGSAALPGTAQTCSEAVWIPQAVLLADDDALADVVTAITKITHAGTAAARVH